MLRSQCNSVFCNWKGCATRQWSVEMPLDNWTWLNGITHVGTCVKWLKGDIAIVSSDTELDMRLLILNSTCAFWHWTRHAPSDTELAMCQVSAAGLYFNSDTALDDFFWHCQDWNDRLNNASVFRLWIYRALIISIKYTWYTDIRIVCHCIWIMN